MKLREVLAAATATLICLANPAMAERDNVVKGEKLDSGLGSLPHFSRWADPRGGHVAGVRVPGESLDSGLGELPYYRVWADRTGKDPLGLTAAATTTAVRVTQAGN